MFGKRDKPHQKPADQSTESHRGREAEHPAEIPKRGWKDILLRVKAEVADDNMSIISAGVAFYLLLAIVPAMAAFVAIYGIFSDPQSINAQLDSVGTMLPADARKMIEEQLTRLASTSSKALGIGAVVGVLISLWSAMNGTKAIITALNVAYDEREKRGFFKLNLIALGLTVGVMVFVVVALTLIAVIPAVLNFLGLGSVVEWTVQILRWPLILAFLLIMLAALYRWAPARDKARWKWVTPGALFAGFLWLLGSIGFSLYVTFFADYNATYGSLGAVVVMLMWMYISTFAVLLGAETNAEIERQTRKDTTEGPKEPIGKRGAYAADTVGEATDTH